MYQQMELQLFGHGQFASKAGTLDVDDIGNGKIKITYWNCVGMIAASLIYHGRNEVVLIDCKNPYDSETDRKVVEGLANVRRIKVAIDDGIPF